MALMLPETSMSPPVPKVGGQGQRLAPVGDASLFPEERASFRPAKPGPRIGIKQWLHQSIQDFKGLGNRILRAERREVAEEKRLRLTPDDLAEIDGDPVEDGKALAKILCDRDRRRFDLDWLDHCEAEYGQDFMADVMTFLNDRYGFAPVVVVPDPIRDAERKRRQEERLQLATEILVELRAEFKAEKER